VRWQLDVVDPRVRCYPVPMTPKNRAKLADRVGKVAETTLTAQHYVSPLGVLVGISAGSTSER